MKKNWRNYEEVSKYILEQFKEQLGLTTVEGKQKLIGQKSKTAWEIDAKGIKTINGAIILIECRRYTRKKLNQESMAALAYRIDDTGAEGGIIISPLGLQKGAQLVAEANNIINVKINANSTPSIFKIEFLDKVVHSTIGNIQSNSATLNGIGSVISICKQCDSKFVRYGTKIVCPQCEEK